MARDGVGRATEEGFLEFAAARTGQLYRTACLLAGGDVHLAEDLVQEALGRVYAQWQRTSWLAPRGRIDNPAGYAQTVLVRTFLSHRRRRSSAEQPTEVLPDHEARPADPLLRIALVEALGRLSPGDRAVLVLRYWEDRSVQETAEVLRVSPGAVRVRSLRALGRIRELIGDDLALLAEA
ncbi:SigE family RNA polymerase sigma factor [Kitasatospora sp. NPDC049258]|uniref:SigE family RNA polymerase sigma factor n=1 Tax=Kitasatospora sp. NPDC049258 TaxID=3155394 RepID=UPI00344269E7